VSSKSKGFGVFSDQRGTTDPIRRTISNTIDTLFLITGLTPTIS
jgi:hypothetical protein